MKDISSKAKFVSITHIETELGQMVAAATDKGICMFEFADSKSIDLELRQLSEHFKAPLVQEESHHFNSLKKQLNEYFKGERRSFDIPLDLVGTEFQKRAWLGLLNIPYGCTISYGKQAELLGKPSSVRAVANANARNKVSIILPCHRVIGSNGTLTGYGGGLWRKTRLLELERENLSLK